MPRWDIWEGIMENDQYFTTDNKHEVKEKRKERLDNVHKILRDKVIEFAKLTKQAISFPPKVSNIEVVTLVMALRQCGLQDLTDELLEDTYNMLLNKLLDNLIKETKKTELLNKLFIPGQELRH